MTANRPTAELEVWGGIECTLNRVQDSYMDQLCWNGHAVRESDLELFANLGIKAIRYPVLWERTAPRGISQADWSWADARLKRLKQLSVLPIVGLIHHGSGPKDTRLDAPSFAPGLANFAGALAERFPWVESYTPVNEPLTTARFSGLYGHWYPHCRDDLAFARALLNQCKAIVLAMREIRRVNRAAQLVQTEDLGKTYSTPNLAYQAEFENERRWVSFDLLCGTLNSDKPMWHFFRHVGVPSDELSWFIDNPCPPDIIGCNYYVIGERLLDERVESYPACAHGGNGRHRYADVEAVRVLSSDIAGWNGLLREAWDRYQLPLALTEVHLNCHREAQIAWFDEAWEAAVDLRAENVDVRAITAWSLLGSYNWNTLVTGDVNYYESGVFDVGNGTPRPTALAKAIRAMATGCHVTMPIRQRRGWWRQPNRLLYKPMCVAAKSRTYSENENVDLPKGPPLLIAGGSGTLGQAFVRICRNRELNFIVCSRQNLDVTEPRSIEREITKYEPWAVINAAGYVRVDDAEQDVERCHLTNSTGAVNLARACAAEGIRLLTFSSDLVFNGDQELPYLEADNVDPLSVYGSSKVEAERAVMAEFPEALIVRTSAFFGPWDRYNFLAIALDHLERHLPVRAADDWIVSPTYVPDLVHRCLDLLIDEESGLWHLANEGTTSWADFARHAALASGFDPRHVCGCRGEKLGLAARRPRFSALGSERGRLLPAIEDAIRRFCDARCGRRATRFSTFETNCQEGLLHVARTA